MLRSAKQLEIFVGRRSGDPADTRQLGDVEFLADVRWIMLEEECRDILSGHLWSADVLSFGFGVLHAAPDARSDHLKLQLGKDASHLEESRRHGINFSAPAVDGNAADDHKAKVFLLNDVDDLAELLGASAQTADFQRRDRVTFLCVFQQHVQALFDLSVSVFVFKNDFLSASGFQFSDLSVDILFNLVGRATGVSIIFHILPPCKRKGKFNFVCR